MWRALLTDALPPCLPATMSFDSVAMSCLVTSLAIFLPRGLRKRRRWLATLLPAFEPGAHFPVRLLDRRLHPRNPLPDDLISNLGLAPLRLPHFPVAEGLGERGSACAPQAVDLVAGIFDGEGLGAVDAQPAGALAQRSADR